MLNLMILGAVFVAISVLAWTGIWRSWADSRFIASALLHAVPGAGLFVVAVAAGSLLPRPLSTLVVAVGIICGVAGLGLAATRSDRLLPRWYRYRLNSGAQRRPDARPSQARRLEDRP